MHGLEGPQNERRLESFLKEQSVSTGFEVVNSGQNLYNWMHDQSIANPPFDAELVISDTDVNQEQQDDYEIAPWIHPTTPDAVARPKPEITDSIDVEGFRRAARWLLEGDGVTPILHSSN